MKQPVEVWMVKLADRITNLAKPPSIWKQDKIISNRNEAIIIHNIFESANHI